MDIGFNGIFEVIVFVIFDEKLDEISLFLVIVGYCGCGKNKILFYGVIFEVCFLIRENIIMLFNLVV